MNPFGAVDKRGPSTATLSVIATPMIPDTSTKQ